jgi:predicted dinucleotide-binding enzyme
MSPMTMAATGAVIGVVGGGRIGRAFARRAASAGISTIIAARRGPDSLEAFAEEVGSLVCPARMAAAVQPEIVLLAVPWPRVAEALVNVADWEGRILVDATNPDGPEALAGLGSRTSSEFVAELAPDAHLVKAFNTLPAELLAADPAEGSGRRVVFLSGDHARAKAEVRRLIARLGFAAVDLGGLAEGGRLQQMPGGPLAGLNLIRIDGRPTPEASVLG